MQLLGPEVHVLAVCQPVVPVRAAVALMAARDDGAQPLSMALMAGPVDGRCMSSFWNTTLHQRRRDVLANRERVEGGHRNLQAPVAALERDGRTQRAARRIAPQRPPGSAIRTGPRTRSSTSSASPTW